MTRAVIQFLFSVHTLCCFVWFEQAEF